MKIKSLITVAIIAPLLALSLAAKAGTCPTPEQFEKKTNTVGNIVFTDKDGDFVLKEKPIAFIGAVFMYPSEPVKGVRYGKLSACRYFLENKTKKFAILQDAPNKIATIEANLTDWKKHIDEKGNERDNRYDCDAYNVEACQFKLYVLKK